MANLLEETRVLSGKYLLETIILGNQTNSRRISQELAVLGLRVVLVDETNSSLEGRYRYLRENSKGLACLLPIGLRIPRAAYDDYVAVILAERYLQSRGKGE